jgi:hypothetical protein
MNSFRLFGLKVISKALSSLLKGSLKFSDISSRGFKKNNNAFEKVWQEKYLKSYNFKKIGDGYESFIG